jgi:DNA-binding MarR family transcriptional regulator
VRFALDVTTNITDRQREVLDYLVTYIRKHGYAPSLREIGSALKIRSTNGVSDHLAALARKGFIEWSSMKARAIRVTLASEPAGTSYETDAATVEEARTVLTLIESTASLPQGAEGIDLVRRLARGLLAQSERRTRLSPADRAAMASLYVVKRLSVSALAELFEVSDRTVRSELARAGVQMRRPGRPPGATTREAA